MSKGSSEKQLSVFENEWFEIKDDGHEQESLKSVILNLLQKSSIYAVSQLVTSSGFGRKVLWLLVLLVGLSGCTYEIYHFLSLYFQYPVVITLEVKNNWKLDFPAVTVCNLNRLSTQNYLCVLMNIPPEECVIEYQTPIRHPPITYMGTFNTEERQKFATCSNDFGGTFSVGRSQILKFLNDYLKHDKKARSQYGYKSYELITSCTFNGETCYVSNFTEFSSLQFGNCFTFNGINKDNNAQFTTPYIGPNSGLEISVSLDTENYIPISSSIGARVMIHESDAEPNPEDHGINISPGYETSVALQQTSIYRLPEPYRDKCRMYDGKTPWEKNQASCITNCMQNVNLHHCGCFDPFLATDSQTLLCDLRNQTTVCCLDDVMKLFNDDNVTCSCPLPCKSTDYEMTISTAEWPSKNFFNQFLKKDFLFWKSLILKGILGKTISNLKPNKEVNTSTEAKETTSTDTVYCKECRIQTDYLKEHREQVAKLKVFYKSLEKISYKQEPMFQDSELFSQLGGQLGLWLGISLVALFECVENVSHLIHYFIKKITNHRQGNRTNAFEKVSKI